jgi:hypothetical protein
VRIPFQRKLDELFRSDSSAWLKIGGGILVGLCVAIQVVMRDGKAENRPTMGRETLFTLLIVTASGGVIGFLLIMKDHVKRRIAGGEQVNLLVRAYLGMGIWSLFLRCPTIFFLGILLIILTH